MNINYIILTLIIILLIYLTYKYIINNDKYINNDIFKYSLMVHLENDTFSKDRIKRVQKIYEDYNLPLINIIPALHWKKNEDEISKYPIEKNSVMMRRPGAYGLAGSFYKCIKKAYDENYPYLLFYEDDAIPIQSKDNFKREFYNVFNTMPENKDGIYMLGTCVFCKTNKKDNKRWIKHNNIVNYTSGSHSIYFGKKSIDKIINHLSKNKLNLPIDDWITINFNPWVWYGDLCDTGLFRGLYKQIDLTCENIWSNSIGVINNN